MAKVVEQLRTSSWPRQLVRGKERQDAAATALRLDSEGTDMDFIELTPEFFTQV